VPAVVENLIRLGFDAGFAGEAGYDPFLQLVLAAEHAPALELGSAVAVASVRNPLQTAQTAHTLQAFTGGRFILGLGTQVRAHVERRYGVAWSRPLARLREFVLAMRAIWRTWNDREPLDFEGEFFRHNLMTPLFDPGPTGYGPPRVFLAAVGPRMAELAGEVADGVLVHSFVTEPYLREVFMPAVEKGLRQAGRARSTFEVQCTPLIAVDAADVARLRAHLGFYGSTLDYRRVLDSIGRGELQPALNARLRSGDRAAMAELVDDDLLAAFCVQGAAAAVPALISERFGGVADRIAFQGPYDDRHAAWIAALHAG
jgi:probable F420-dependent oxidoreductase